MGFLISYFHHDWSNFIARTTGNDADDARRTASAAARIAEAKGIDIEAACASYSTLQMRK
eukprot:2661616-Pleurochrysis_carterae.AAC.1